MGSATLAPQLSQGQTNLDGLSYACHFCGSQSTPRSADEPSLANGQDLLTLDI